MTAEGQPAFSFIKTILSSKNSDRVRVVVTADLEWIVASNEIFRPEIDIASSCSIAETTAKGFEACISFQSSGCTPFLFAQADYLLTDVCKRIHDIAYRSDMKMVLVGMLPDSHVNINKTMVPVFADIGLARLVHSMSIFSASDAVSACSIAHESMRGRKLCYVRLPSTARPGIYDSQCMLDIKKGMSILCQGRDLCLISTGKMVPTALQTAKMLAGQGIETGVIDLHRIRPLSSSDLYDAIARYTYIASLEDHPIEGGVGSMMLETLSDYGKSHAVIRMGLGAAEKSGAFGQINTFESEHLDLESIIKVLSEKVW